MKKIISTILVCVLLVSSLFAMASCSLFEKKLNGKYERDITLPIVGSVGTASYEFDGNSVTYVTTTGSLSVTTNGTYKIDKDENDKYVITFDWDEESSDGDQEEEGVALSLSEIKKDGEEYIEINGIEYKKVK